MKNLKHVLYVAIASFYVWSGNFGATTSAAENDAVQNAAEKVPKEESVQIWRVSGRVVDHRGLSVERAEVILLGEESIMVNADRPDKWYVKQRGQAKRPPSTRTDENGEFSIRRSDKPGNRLAVISSDPLLWIVSGDKLKGRVVGIRLPASGSLSIQCDLPRKPATLPIHIQLRTFDGINWNTDVLGYHWGNYSIKNPGESVFDNLPPARYSVERVEETQTGDRRILMTPSERQLVDVVSNECATVAFNRKVGRPIAGRVRGLEDTNLSYAYVSIRYWGPREQSGRRRDTAFDVIPIKSDGRFTIDPIPPGDYRLDVFAVRRTTVNPRRSDYHGRLSFTVTREGELPTARDAPGNGAPKN